MTSVLQKTKVQADRPWRAELIAPEAAGLAARIAQIEASLSAFAPIVRPLALSLQRGWRARDTGLFDFDPAAAPPTAHLSAELSAFGARRRALHTGRAEETVGPEASAQAVRSWLESTCGGSGPRGVVDVQRLETLAAAVRVEADGLEVVGATRAPVVVATGDARWVAGPIDEEGFGAWPPAKLTWDAEDGPLRLEVAVFWTRWIEPGTPERSGLDAALTRLEDAGWRGG